MVKAWLLLSVPLASIATCTVPLTSSLEGTGAITRVEDALIGRVDAPPNVTRTLS